MMSFIDYAVFTLEGSDGFGHTDHSKIIVGKLADGMWPIWGKVLCEELRGNGNFESYSHKTKVLA